MVNDPDPGTTLVTRAVASAVAAMAQIYDDVVTSEFVTVTVVPAAAMFTRPLILFIVWLPVVPGAVIVAGTIKFWASVNVNSEPVDTAPSEADELMLSDASVTNMRWPVNDVMLTTVDFSVENQPFQRAPVAPIAFAPVAVGTKSPDNVRTPDALRYKAISGVAPHAIPVVLAVVEFPKFTCLATPTPPAKMPIPVVADDDAVVPVVEIAPDDVTAPAFQTPLVMVPALVMLSCTALGIVDNTSGDPVPAVLRPTNDAVAMFACLASVTTPAAMVVATEPALVVMSPVRAGDCAACNVPDAYVLRLMAVPFHTPD